MSSEIIMSRLLGRGEDAREGGAFSEVDNSRNSLEREGSYAAGAALDSLSLFRLKSFPGTNGVILLKLNCENVVFITAFLVVSSVLEAVAPVFFCSSVPSPTSDGAFASTIAAAVDADAGAALLTPPYMRRLLSTSASTVDERCCFVTGSGRGEGYERSEVAETEEVAGEMDTAGLLQSLSKASDGIEEFFENFWYEVVLKETGLE
jgi:hypothetical protein